MVGPDQGFVLVRPPSAAAHEWATSHGRKLEAAVLVSMRTALPQCEPHRYRGLQRNAFSESDDGPRYAEANAILRTSVERHPPTWPAPHSLIAHLDDARRILSQLPSSESWELLGLSLASGHSSATLLGFDVGYWGGGDYSILADAVIMPRWHPAPPDALPQLQLLLSKLNTHLLFSDRTSAEAYLAYYLTQPWAEVDGGGEFQIQRVETIGPMVSA